MTNYVNVCLSFDENYAQHAAVTMMSAVLNCSRPIAFYVLDSTPSCISEHSKRMLNEAFQGTDAVINFTSVDYKDYVNGSTRLKLTQSDMRSIKILLPPLPEQKRISVKVKYLFCLLDTIACCL